MKENLKIETPNHGDSQKAHILFKDMGYLNVFDDEMYVYAICNPSSTQPRIISFDELRELARPKEYLNDKFELVVTNQPDDGFILVPDGANRYTRAINGHETFWDNDNSILIHGGYADMSGRYTFGYYVEHYKAKILWQRENKVETVKGLDGNAGRFLHQEWLDKYASGLNIRYHAPRWEKDIFVDVDQYSQLDIFNNSEVIFSLKPQTIQIGSRTIVKPISVKPETGTFYYVPKLDEPEKCIEYIWADNYLHDLRFDNNLCHLISENAVLHCEALRELIK